MEMVGVAALARAVVLAASVCCLEPAISERPFLLACRVCVALSVQLGLKLCSISSYILSKSFGS